MSTAFFVTIFIFLLAYSFLVNKYEKLGHWLDDNIWYRFDAAKRIIIYEKSFADRFYNNFSLLNVWDSKEVFFVIRHKDNFTFKTIQERELPKKRHQHLQSRH